MLYPFLLPLGKFVLATGLLVVFYFLLYRRSAAYNQLRLFLLLLPFVAILLACVKLEVYDSPLQLVEIDNSVAPDNTVQAKKELSSYVNKEELSTLSPIVSNVLEADWKKVITYVYLVVTAILLCCPLSGVIRVIYLKRKSKREEYCGIQVIRSEKIKTPFSFFRTIYLSDTVRQSKVEMILAHERWHVMHKHYMDVILIEIVTRLCWFNPLLWWVRHELRDIHEFQADRSVLDNGQNIYEYQTTLLEEVMSNSICMANGFNHSFIKQRFVAMKNQRMVRFYTLRNILIVPLFLVLFICFTFTEGEAKIIYVTSLTPKVDTRVSEMPKEITLSEKIEESGVLKNADIEKEAEKLALNAPAPAKTPKSNPSSDLSPTAPAPEAAPAKEKSKEAEVWKESPEVTGEGVIDKTYGRVHPNLPQYSKVVVSSIPYKSDISACPIYIEREENRTLVTRIKPIESDWDYMIIPEKHKVALVDCRTGDSYMLREVCNDYPTGYPFYIRHHQKQMIEITFVYPPLPSSVKMVDILDGWNVYNVKVKDHLRKKIKVVH